MEKTFVKGIFLQKKLSKFGTFLKGNINLKEIENNPIKDGLIHFCIFETKQGKPYVVIDDYKPQQKQEEVKNFDDDEVLPF